MFDETQGADPGNTANFQFDNVEMDPLLSQFAKSPEKGSLLNDSFSISTSDRVRHEPYLGRANRENSSILFPYQQKTEQCTLWTSAKLHTERGFSCVVSIMNPSLKKEMVGRKESDRRDGINRGLAVQYKPTNVAKDTLGSAIERKDYVLLDTISVMTPIDGKEEEMQLFVIQKYKVVSRLGDNNEEVLKLTVKRMNPRTESFQDFSKYDQVPEKVLSVSQFNSIIDKSKEVIEERLKGDFRRKRASQ
jgi:hypothetical protein